MVTTMNYVNYGYEEEEQKKAEAKNKNGNQNLCSNKEKNSKRFTFRLNKINTN